MKTAKVSNGDTPDALSHKRQRVEDVLVKLPQNRHPDPDFLYVAPSTTACAAFREESRMRFASAAKLHRKSGGAERLTD